MKINLANIKKARNLLNKRECVAIPTETVYGIAGNAYSDTACKKIFRLKKRPMNNPLIIHYYDLKKLKDDCDLNGDFLKLYKVKAGDGALGQLFQKTLTKDLQSL